MLILSGIRRKRISTAIVLMMLFHMFFGIVTPKLFAGGEAPLAISKSVSVDQIKTGQQFHYTILYSVNDLENNYDDVYIKDLLPAGVEFISVARNNQTKTIEHNPATNAVTIQLVNDGTDTLLAGTTGSIQINVRIPNGSVVDGTVFTNVATIEATGVEPVTSNEAVVTTFGSQSYWKTTKSQIIPSISPVVDSEVTYQVGLTDNDSGNPYGHINADNVVMIDYLPEKSLFISATGGGVYDPVTHTVTWNLGNLKVGDNPTRRVTINYPSPIGEDPGFVTGDTAVNRVTATGQYPGGNALVIPDSTTTTTFAVAAPAIPGDISFQKTRQFAYRHIDQTQSFTIGNIKNPGNVPLNNFIVEDSALPPQLDYEKIHLPQLNMEHPYTFYYQNSTSPDWILHNITEPEKTAGLVLVSSFDLNLGYLTGFKFDFGTVPASFDAGQIRIEGKVINPDNEGNAVTHGDSISNTAQLTYDYDGNPPESMTSTATFFINQPKPWLVPNKTHDASKFYIPGDTVTFTLNIANKIDATGPYKRPVIYDLLPEGFDYIADSWAFAGSNIPAVVPIFSVIPNFNGTEQTLLKWSWESTDDFVIPIGESIRIDYAAWINPILLIP